MGAAPRHWKELQAGSVLPDGGGVFRMTAKIGRDEFALCDDFSVVRNDVVERLLCKRGTIALALVSGGNLGVGKYRRAIVNPIFGKADNVFVLD